MNLHRTALRALRGSVTRAGPQRALLANSIYKRKDNLPDPELRTAVYLLPPSGQLDYGHEGMRGGREGPEQRVRITQALGISNKRDGTEPRRTV